MNSESCNNFSIGRAVFKQSLPKKIKQNLKSTTGKCKQQSQMLKQRSWSIYQEFIESNWKTLFDHMQSSSCEELHLFMNQCPSVLKSITIPIFQNLNLLVLQQNNIHNIELIACLDMPNLQEIYLNQNYITEAKSFDKSKFNKLKVLETSKNYIPSVYLNRLHIKCRFDDQRSEWLRIFPLSEQLSVIAKSQTSPTTFNFQFFSSQSIFQNKVYSVLQRRITKQS